MTAVSIRIGQLVRWCRNRQNTMETRRKAKEELEQRYGLKVLEGEQFNCGFTSLAPSKYKRW